MIPLRRIAEVMENPQRGTSVAEGYEKTVTIRSKGRLFLFWKVLIDQFAGKPG
jgi:hypothetical protein